MAYSLNRTNALMLGSFAIALLSTILLLHGTGHINIYPVTITLDKQQISQETADGHAFVYAIPFAQGDSTANPNASKLVLFEDEIQLGPGHSVHEDIRVKGKGRYSHWGTALIFSSSDTTDPRENKHTYTVRYQRVQGNFWFCGVTFFLLSLGVYVGCARLSRCQARHLRAIALIFVSAPLLYIALRDATAFVVAAAAYIATIAAILTETKPTKTTGKLALLISMLAITAISLFFIFRFSQNAQIMMHLVQPYKMQYNIFSDPLRFATAYFDSLNLANISLYISAWFMLIGKYGYDAAIFVMHCAGTIALCCGIFYLIYAESRNIKLSILLTFLLLNSELISAVQVGANGYINEWPIHIWLAAGFFFLALGLLARGLVYSALICEALVILVHPVLGATTGLVLSALLFLHRKRFGLASFLVATLGLGLYFTAQYLVKNTGLNMTQEQWGLWMHWVSILNSGHILLDRGIGYWSSLIAWSMLAVAFIATYVTKRVKNDPASLLPTAFLLVVLLCLAMAPVLTYQLHHSPFLLQPYRLMGIFAVALLCYNAVQLVCSSAPPTLWSRLLQGIALAALLSPSTMGVFVFSVAVTVASISEAERDRRVVGWACLGVLGLLAALENLWVLPGLSPRWPAMLLLAGVCLFQKDLWRIREAGLAHAILITALVGLFLWRAPTYFVATHYLDTIQHVEDAGAWIEQNTPEDLPLLVSPGFSSYALWEATANRGSLLQIRKMAYVRIKPELLEPFNAYLQVLGVDITQQASHRDLATAMRTAWAAMDTDKAHDMMQRYQASCLVTENTVRFDLPVLYENEMFTVYGHRAGREE